MNTREEVRVEIEERKVALLKELILLTHPSVSHFGMDEKTVTQWGEFLRQFPDEHIGYKILILNKEN